TDASGEPIIGANVVESGTTNGTITDFDGKFTLSIAPNSTVIITYIGYVEQRVAVGDQTNLSITLKEDSQALEEVVVIGYGTQKKVNLSGSVSSVNMSELTESRPITNISNGLAGMAAGVQVTSSSNRPGNDNSSILVRGQGTLNNSAPLIIIDGMEGNINSVNPQDIESLSILKDAASAAIYGSRAANGVILITTKQGKSGAMKVEYTGYVSFESINKTMTPVSNYADYMGLVNEGYLNSNQPAPFKQETIELWRSNENGDQLMYPNTDWIDETFTTSVATNHSLSVSGGSEKIRFYTAFGYMDDPGVMDNSGYSKYNLRANLDADVKSWLKIGTNLSGYIANTQPGTDKIENVFTYGSATTPGMVFRSPDGRYGAMNNLEDDPQSGTNNPLYGLNSIYGKYTKKNTKARIFGTLLPFKGFTLTASYSYENVDEQQENKPIFIDLWNFQNNTITKEGTGRTSISNKNIKQERNFMDVVARYENHFFDKLDLNVMAGGSQEQYGWQWFNASKLDLIDPGLGVINGAVGDASANGTRVEWAMRSFFGRINLGWDNKYLLELNMRADGSSRFLPDQRWGYFPSISAAWRIDQEDFMTDFSSTWLSNLKLRLSYGSLGNNAVGGTDQNAGNYSALSTYSTTNYVLNNALAMGLSQTAIANAALTWETTKIANIGLDFGVINNKLSGTLDYFHKKTDGILIDLPAPAVHGNASIPKQNSAVVVNQGIEFTLGWQDKIGDFSYSINGNVTWLKNEVTRFKGDDYSLSGAKIIKEGLPINAQYVLLVDRIIQTDEDLALVQKFIDNAPIDESTGKAKNPFAAYGKPAKGDLLYKDTNGDGLINDEDRQVVGRGPNPDFSYGLNMAMAYKGIDFSVLFQGVSGVKMIYNDGYFVPTVRLGYQINKDIADGRWTEGRTDATYPRLLHYSDSRNTQNSDLWVQDKSYLKIKSIQLGYTLPKSWLSKIDIERVRIYGSLENFFTFTDFKGLDPEVEKTNYPTMRQAVIGLNVSF
ncbi:TonB-dependent receptor, partial [Massilibacteroides sp.]|uniref:SusC/RagA family TonB-linked outer membrane protein n=1 Tax=Massilibacteroides sp. TaxID=2034766 RepID=UPI002602523A